MRRLSHHSCLTHCHASSRRQRCWTASSKQRQLLFKAAQESRNDRRHSGSCVRRRVQSPPRPPRTHLWRTGSRQPPSPPPSALSLAVAVALLASSQPAFSLEQGTISIVPWLEILLPNFLAIAELTAFCALGTLVAPLAFVALLVCDARRVALAYGTLALAIPFLLPSPYTNGTGPMAQALVIYIAYWKLLDVLCGTAPAAVLATPRNTLVHFAFLLEYRVAKEAKAGEKESLLLRRKVSRRRRRPRR